MKRVGIIGSGIFGCSAAIELERNGFHVTIFDRADNILDGASTVNHLRHHYGFHYPRSKETVEEIKIARETFEKEYGDCVSEFFDDFYGVSKEGSKTDADGFIKFCDDMGLPYEIAWPDEKYMDRSKISICVKTPERVYDPDILKGLIFQKMMGKNIDLRLNSKVVGGSVEGKEKKFKILEGEREYEDSFDYVINATYSNFNNFNKMFGFPRKTFLYELMELLEVSLPNKDKIGLTIMDGAFSSLLPRGEKGTYTLGHVDASVLKARTSDDLDPVDMALENVESNRDEIMAKGIEDYPFLEDAQVIRSLHVTRVVKANVDDTDERPSEITEYGNGMYSIFGGKIITSVNIAKKITEKILEDQKE